MTPDSRRVQPWIDPAKENIQIRRDQVRQGLAGRGSQVRGGWAATAFHLHSTMMANAKDICMKQAHLILATLALLVITVPRQATAQDLIEEPLRIPMPEAGHKGLEAFMVRPNDTAPHPLALLTHGTPREASQRVDVTALNFVPQAREFARRGWTTVIVVRRNYGSSGGSYAEEGRACSSRPNYYDAGKESARDLRFSISYLSTLPQVDPARII